MVRTRVLLLVCSLPLVLAACATSVVPGQGLDTYQGSKIDPTAFNVSTLIGKICVNAPDECDSSPKLVSGRSPAYPQEALAAKQAGEVVVAFDIAESGVTERIEILSATSADFSDAAHAAIDSWRFEPAKLGGEPVRIRGRVTLPFSPTLLPR